MTKNFIKLLFLLMFLIQGVAFARAETLEALRDQFKSAENQIIAKYDTLAHQPGADQFSLLKQMNKELAANRKTFSGIAGKDPRYTKAEVKAAFEGGKLKAIPEVKQGPGYIDQINSELAKKNLKLSSTGGSSDLTPTHINADVDAVVVKTDGTPATAAEQLEGIEIIKKHGVEPGEILHENAARFDNRGKDLTIWKPDSPEGQQAKLTDHDAFKTEGGRNVTRNPGAVQDAHGEYLDNRAKFEAARVEGDLKTQAKSLVKAGGGEASGVKTIVTDANSNETVARKSDFKESNPELYDKAKKLKEYGTTHEAGVTEIGDSPEVKQQKIAQFQEEMATEMDSIKRQAQRKGQIRDGVRENFQESYAKAADPEIAKISDTIGQERARVTQSNEGALEAIAHDQSKATAKESFTGGRRGPGDPGYSAQPSDNVPVADVPEPQVSRSGTGAVEGAGESSGNLVSDTSLADRRAGMTGEQTPSLLDGGKASVQSESIVGKARSKIQAAETAMGQLAEADMARFNNAGSKVGVTVAGELPAAAGGFRRAANSAAEAGAGALAVAGAAYEGGTIGYGVGSTLVNLRDAYNEDDSAMRDHLLERAKNDAIGTAEHVGTTAVMVGGAVASPVIVGGAMTGYGTYQVTRAGLEHTEAGKAIDKSVQDAMTSGMTSLDDAARYLSGQKSYDEINRDTLNDRQAAWLRALERGDIQLQEGATVQDMLDYVRMQQEDGKVSSLDRLGDMANVVQKAGKVEGAPGDGTDGTQKRFADDERVASDVLGSKRFVDDERLLGKDGIPKRFADDGLLLGDRPEESDSLADAMLANQPTDQEKAQWRNQNTGQNEAAIQLVKDFTSTNPAGETEEERKQNTATHLTRDSERIKKKDVEEDKEKKDEQVRQQEDSKRQRQGLDEDQFSNDWSSTVQGINDALNNLNQQDAAKVKQMTEAAIALIQQMQSGTLSDSDFTSKLTQLENEGAQLTNQARQGWTNIVDQLMGGQVNPGGGIGGIQIGGGVDPCAMNFTMNSNMELKCQCPGYTFDTSKVTCVGGAGAGVTGGDAATSILNSVPPGQIDQRFIVCDTTSKSGGNTPASISVDMKGGTGVATLAYDLYSVKDRILVQVNGGTVSDTGCTNGKASMPIQVSGGDQVRVIVQPACAGSSTSWNFSVSCPRQAF